MRGLPAIGRRAFLVAGTGIAGSRVAPRQAIASGEGDAHIAELWDARQRYRLLALEQIRRAAAVHADDAERHRLEMHAGNIDDLVLELDDAIADLVTLSRSGFQIQAALLVERLEEAFGTDALETRLANRLVDYAAGVRRGD